MATTETNTLKEVAGRIRALREIVGISEADMARQTEVAPQEYAAYESGSLDFPFSFIHKCARVLGVGLTDLLEGQSAHLSSYTVTRRGNGQPTAREDGIEIRNLAPFFEKKIAEPYYVRYEYNRDLQNRPIHLSHHAGQEFDYVLQGRLKVQVGDNIEYLGEGDSIFYNSSTPHGMVAVDGADCLFLALILPGESRPEPSLRETLIPSRHTDDGQLPCHRYVRTQEDENGALTRISFSEEDTFNFAFDIVDETARRMPEKLAMLHIAADGTERRFTFRDIKQASARCANYFKAQGILPGDRVMLCLKRHWQFWPAILGLHKLGAVAIPATHQLQAHDFTYRFESAGVKALVCISDDDVPARAEAAMAEGAAPQVLMLVGGSRPGWRDFDAEFPLYSTHFSRTANTPCGRDPMLMFFTSGTTGYPKIATHDFRYPLGHYLTAKYWHGVEEDGLHFTISDTGWGKALWGKLYGQWMCGGAVFVYDFDRFHASDILPMFAKYRITSFCAPPTMLRMMIKEDLRVYDLSSVRHMTTAGEALNPEVYRRFEELTGLQIHEGFGQTETTLSIGNLMGKPHKVGSMGMPVPLYDVKLLDTDGSEVPMGKPGEIVIRAERESSPCGLFSGYYRDEEKTAEVWHDGWYHTGDLAWRDEDGYYWYVGRADDVIKSSGYRIGPFEIESVIMELPYVLECGVSAAPDPVRGQVVKASVVLVPGTSPSEELKAEIQQYVKEHTAPYKYPRIVVFRDELPKTTSGKIRRNML